MNNIQKTAAYAVVDAGTLLIIGSHPHLLQPMEWYKGKLIAYSLGNFVFDGFSGDSNLTAVLHVVLNPQGLQRYEWIPIVIDAQILPRPASENEAEAILARLTPLAP